MKFVSWSLFQTKYTRTWLILIPYLYQHPLSYQRKANRNPWIASDLGLAVEMLFSRITLNTPRFVCLVIILETEIEVYSLFSWNLSMLPWGCQWTSLVSLSWMFRGYTHRWHYWIRFWRLAFGSQYRRNCVHLFALPY